MNTKTPFYRGYFLLSLFFYQFLLLAQPTNNYINDVVTPTPNAAALGTYLNTPVNYSTGVPSISIPIHTMQSGKIYVALGLNYHAGGVR